jgi:tetratricopeptide (TPR) repeat protein
MLYEQGVMNMGIIVNNRRYRQLLLLAAAASVFGLSDCAQARMDSRTPASAKALKAIARVYMVAGRYDAAAEAARLAVEAARTESNADVMTASCLVDQAWAELQLGRYASAWSAGVQGLEIQKQVYGQQHVYVAYTLRILSAICRERGDYRQARQLLEQSIAIMNQNAPGENELAPFWVDLAGILVAEGKYFEADDMYNLAREKVSASFGQSHLYTATVTVKVAQLYIRENRFDEARQLLEAAYPVQKEVYGQDSYNLVDTWVAMAAIFEHNGELLKAENMLKRALGMVEKQYSKEHPEAARIMGTLAEFYLNHGDYERAETSCHAALERLKNALGDNHDATAMAMNTLARLYVRQGRTAEASQLCTEAVMALSQVFEPGHPDFVKVRQTLSSLLLAKAPDNLSNVN